MKNGKPVFVLSLAMCFLFCTVAHGQARTPAPRVVDQATVPLTIEGNRPFVEITFHRSNGSTRFARFLIDSGGGGFILSEALARDIGLRWGAVSQEEGSSFALAEGLPQASIEDFSLQLNPKRVIVQIGADNILPKVAPGHADGLLPGHVLAQYHVVFDYPKSTFTIARPGVLKPKGDELPMPVSRKSGFPRTQIEVNGTTYGFLIDTGASFTMVSEVLLKSWGHDHAAWPRHTGAFGEATTLGGMTLETMFVPSGTWGTQQLKEFGVVSQREGTFERYMSSMMAAPIVGSLAGNVLNRYRVELDYPNAKLYLSAP